MIKTIQVPDEMPVTFTAKELTDLINHLGTGQFNFVNPIISFMNERLIQAYQSTTEEDPKPKPIGGGGGGSPKPKPNA